MRRALFAVFGTLLLLPGLAAAKTYAVLSADYGHGHNTAAASFKREILAHDPEAKFLEINMREYLRPSWFSQMSKDQFNESQRKGSKLYDLSFELYMQLGRRMKSVAHMPIGHIFDLERLHETLRTAAPDAIISTYPFATEVLAYYKERGLINVPTIWQHTDMVPRKYFAKLAAAVDRVCVAHESVAEYFRKHFVKEGFPANRVYTTGMPINLPPPRLLDERRKLLVAEGFDPDIPIVVIEGGSNGVGPYAKFIQRFHEKSPVPLQIVAFCANNVECKKELDALKLPKNSNVKAMKAYGFMKQSDPEQAARYFGLLESATVDLTKPGGLSPFERMSRELPLVLHSVRTSLRDKDVREADTASKREKILKTLKKLFGRTPKPEELEEAFRLMSQEGYNAEVLQKEGVGLLARVVGKDEGVPDAVDKAIRLLMDPALREEMKANQRKFIQSMNIKPAIDWLTGPLPAADWSKAHPPTFPFERCSWILGRVFTPRLSTTSKREIYKLRKTRKPNN